MRDRLYELIEKSGILCKDCGDYGDTYCCEAIADHLLASGVIVLPVKVGDTLFVLDRRNKIQKYIVTEIDCTIGGYGKRWKVTAYNTDYDVRRYEVFTDYEFGYIVFFTKEEAEKAVAQMNKEGER